MPHPQSVRGEVLALAGNRARAKSYEKQNEVSQVRGGKVSPAIIGKKALELHEMEHNAMGHPAHHQGYHLGQHLKKLHGGMFSHKFIEGMMGANEDGDELYDNDQLKGRGRTMGCFDVQTQHGYHEKEEDNSAMLHGGIATGAYEGGAWWDVLDPAKNGLTASVNASNEKIKNDVNASNEKIKNEFVNPDSVLRKKVLPVARKLVAPVGNALGSFYGMPDAGSKVDKGLSMVGLGKKKRKPAGENDGRRKRSAVVNKVIAEKGLSMIEASKYVKAHNLY